MLNPSIGLDQLFDSFIRSDDYCIAYAYEEPYLDHSGDIANGSLQGCWIGDCRAEGAIQNEAGLSVSNGSEPFVLRQTCPGQIREMPSLTPSQRSESTSTGRSNAPSTSTFLVWSATTTIDLDFRATTFSLVRAPPLPLSDRSYGRTHRLRLLLDLVFPSPRSSSKEYPTLPKASSCLH